MALKASVSEDKGLDLQADGAPGLALWLRDLNTDQNIEGSTGRLRDNYFEEDTGVQVE